MARTPNVKIVEWGTPPELPTPEPTGWDAVAVQLKAKPGEWANVGEFSPATARKVGAERLTTDAGYELRAVPTDDPRRVTVWVRAGYGEVETRDADEPGAVVDLDAPTAKRATVKRGAVV